jgi:O-phospho-L-seryl-tRNASec:L-selenocysteinyl-tRNA synthase
MRSYHQQIRIFSFLLVSEADVEDATPPPPWFSQWYCCPKLMRLLELYSSQGGAVVVSPDEAVIQTVGKMYAGRANASPCIDLFITLLSMGLEGYKSLLEERKRFVSSFQQRLSEVADKHGERLLVCPSNTVSLGITLNTLASSSNKDGDAPTEEEEFMTEAERAKRDGLQVSYFGSMLFTRCVSGTRVVSQKQTKMISGMEFLGFGSSTDDYGDAYLTAACAIGVTQSELDEFCIRLDKAFIDFRKKKLKK